jgi:hypothetical protein
MESMVFLGNLVLSYTLSHFLKTFCTYMQCFTHNIVTQDLKKRGRCKNEFYQSFHLRYVNMLNFAQQYQKTFFMLFKPHNAMPLVDH